jgi:class 3 adenylate cyclase
MGNAAGVRTQRRFRSQHRRFIIVSMPGHPTRRLATVLFLDIVGSTALASELGDRRWRELLTRFRRLVRAQLKRHGGREQDTAGDGFFATFSHPAEAIRAAVAIAGAVNNLGLAIRLGIHTGECELIDGKLGGIAVHIGSRVMALAGPAEVLVTGTVRDLVVGSGMSFEERGAHELKGLPGTWAVYGLLEVDNEPIPAPLSPSEALVRLAAVEPDLRRRRRRRRALGAAAAGGLVALAVTIPLLAFGGGTRAASTGARVSVVRLDPVRSRIVATLRDHAVSVNDWGRMWIVNGTLWQQIRPHNVELVRRDVRTGRIEQTIPVPADTLEFAFGFGSIWLLRSVGTDLGHAGPDVERIDQLSGRPLKTIPLSGVAVLGQATIAAGAGAVWVLSEGGALTRIDPLADRVTGTYQTGAIETTTLIPLTRYAWICECVNHQVLRFDERTHATTTFTIPEHAVLAGVVSKRRQTLWLLDTGGATLTPMNPRSGATGQPLGLEGKPQQAVIAFGAIWAAAGHVVDRVDLQTRQRSTVGMPPGVWAGSIAADPGSGAIWIGNSVGPPQPQPR